MKECWSEGELRAYLDRELPPDDLDRVAAHLEQCSRCQALRAGLAARAVRVSTLLEQADPGGEAYGLPELARLPKPRRGRAWKVGAALAMAAAFTIAFAVHLGQASRPVRQPSTKRPEIAAVPPAPPPVEVAAPVTERRRPVRPRPRAALPRVHTDYFMALDDEPIDTGIVVRVALGPDELKADVIFDPAGRPRAIRPVQ